MGAKKSISFPCIKVSQPIGDFYIGTIPCTSLYEISYADIRRIKDEGEREIERYLGIQRPLNDSRVEEIKKYVHNVDACFPTAVILAVSSDCADFDEKKKIMTLTEFKPKNPKEAGIAFTDMANILDGQHRLAGFMQYEGATFDINVSIFVDADLPTQANIFSTVNLAQTKVKKSLVYDLYDLAKSRSPQKSAHLIAVGLDHRTKESPFYKRIKRLGVATPGRLNETITQATFVESLLRYISSKPAVDRNAFLRKERIPLADAKELQKRPFRNLFLTEKETVIEDIIFNYFDAVRKRWSAWNNFGTGNMLNKTNGFKALMRLLGPAYRSVAKEIGEVPSTKDFLGLFNKVKLKDTDFKVTTYKPGSSGEMALYRELLEQTDLEEQTRTQEDEDE